MKNYDYNTHANLKSMLESKYNASLDRSRRKYYTESVDHYVISSSQPMSIETRTEFGIEITLSERDFLHLCEDINRIDQIDDLRRKLDFEWSRMLESFEAERKIREANPSLQKAYEKYKLMLDMVSGRKDGQSS